MCVARAHQNAWCLIRTRRQSQLVRGALMSLPLTSVDFWTPASSFAVCFSPGQLAQINARATLEASFCYFICFFSFQPHLRLFLCSCCCAGRPAANQTSLELKVYRPRAWASWISTKAPPLKESALTQAHWFLKPVKLTFHKKRSFKKVAIDELAESTNMSEVLFFLCFFYCI